MERTMVLMMGIQGSGKRKFFRRFLADEYVRVNLDTLKTRQQEKLFITACIENGESFAVDNTNPTKADRNRYIPLARAAGYRIIGYFMESKLKECLARNDLRHASAAFSLQLGQIAVFDCRIVPLPDAECVQDYFLWRQEDAHRNALNAHCYWLLRKEGMDVRQATEQLKGKSASYKNELLFSRGIHFRKIPAWQKHGIGIYWTDVEKTGFNPIKNTLETTLRRTLQTDFDLPLREEYGNLVLSCLEYA